MAAYWLDLENTNVTDEGLTQIGQFPNLTRLQNTPVSDAGLQQMAGLSNLEYLNLYRTEVTDSGTPGTTVLEQPAEAVCVADKCYRRGSREIT
ncbi:MAG: hypothetical protein U5K69_23125 [Balneolaceae bacterium]|nr:hypothetical protein [Balneolaceae bacterium]